MTDIQKLLNTTAAGLLAQKLDKKDGKQDGKISGSIWNQFVEANEVGKKINEQGSISIENAMKSITTYVVRKVKADNTTEGEVVKDFNAKADQIEASAPAEPTDETTPEEAAAAAEPTDETTPEEPTAAAKPAAPVSNAEQAKADYQKVKVKVPIRYSSEEVKYIIAAQKDAKKAAVHLAKGNPNIGLDIRNTAYAIKGKKVDFGPGRRKAAKAVFENLVARMKMLKIDQKGDHVTWDEFNKLSYKDQNNILINYRDRIIAADNEIIKKDNAEKTKFNNEIRPKAQQTFDDATKFMADVANMNSKPKIERGHNDADNYDWAKVKLSDGRRIKVIYDNNGKISSISHDTTLDHESDGTTFDGNDVAFTSDGAWFNYDKSNETWEGSITSGYDFEQLKALAEKIFGPKE